MSVLIQGSLSYHHHHTHQKAPAHLNSHLLRFLHTRSMRGRALSLLIQGYFSYYHHHTHKKTPAHFNHHLLRFLHTRSMRGGAMSLLIQGSFHTITTTHTHTKNTSAFQPPPAAFPAHALHARGSHVTAHTRISFIPSPPHTHKETPAHLNSHLLRFLHTRSMRGGEPCQCSYKDPIHTITTTHTKNTSPFELPPAAFPAHALHARERALSLLIQGSFSYYHHHTHKKHQPI